MEKMEKYLMKHPKANQLSAEGKPNESRTNDLNLRRLSAALKLAGPIQTLYINCPKTDDVTDVGLGSISYRIRTLTSLKSLGINLSGFEKRNDRRFIRISDEGISHLGKALRHLTSLRSLCLNFKFCYELSDTALDCIGQALKRMILLESFDLNMNQFLDGISEEGLKNLSQGFKNLVNLKSLSLKFKRSQASTDKGLAYLGQGVRNLVSLKRIHLKFSWCENIGDKGLGSLSEALEKLTCLEMIHLNFKRWNWISDRGIKRLGQALKTRGKLLKDVRLNFDLCEKVTSTGIKSIGQALDGMNCLENLKIEFEVM